MKELISDHSEAVIEDFQDSLKISLPKLLDELGDGQKKIIGCPSGFAELDELTSGISGLVVLGGVPGSGKSALASQILFHAAEQAQIPALYYSLEMGKLPVFVRILNRISRHSFSEIVLSGKVLAEQSLTFQQALTRIQSCSERLFLFDQGGLQRSGNSFQTLREQIKNIKLAFGKRPFVVLDSLHAFPVVGNTAYRDEKGRLDLIMNQLREITDEIGVDILVISHLNRESAKENNKIRLQSFMGSAGIEHTADICLVLSREIDENNTLTPAPSNEVAEVVLHCLKNRYGIRKQINLRFELKFSNFE